MRITCAALVALAAINMGLKRDLVADLYVLYVPADLLDYAAALVAEHEGILGAVFVIELLAGSVPLPAAVVGAAYGGGLYFNKYLLVAGDRLRYVDVLHARSAFFFDDGSHGSSSVINDISPGLLYDVICLAALYPPACPKVHRA